MTRHPASPRAQPRDTTASVNQPDQVSPTRGLGVTPDEVTAAYTPELRAATTDGLNQALRS
ncbi:hypothetical protein OG978_43640 (plasmid) [Streptomyces sp. NBC_01591]|uniref:hypothetical protein n=1 Tax=Streptomyces sp. NBC_01591 TaxID=2975888 RepID=UPI002DD81352|nr:hypothetical protein [Streptomyces sp. NBC_01591]WSD74052.1 hypothetical protein OG978_43640 [Streptomyces sp. NBC_01591]